VHGHQRIEQEFARLQEQAQHEGIALVSGESPEVFGAVACGLLEEVVKKRGSDPLDLTIIDPRCGDGVIPL
jgi:hypothetical protein